MFGKEKEQDGKITIKCYVYDEKLKFYKKYLISFLMQKI